jgi:hypothetical protein
MLLELPPNSVGELAVEHKMEWWPINAIVGIATRPGAGGEDAFRIQRAENHHGPRPSFFPIFITSN